jgi:hypothetical protein
MESTYHLIFCKEIEDIESARSLQVLVVQTKLLREWDFLATASPATYMKWMKMRPRKGAGGTSRCGELQRHTRSHGTGARS